MKSISIGRDSSCDIVINNDRVSRFHASITPTGNGYIFRDRSHNGTRINGTIIRNGEKLVRFGDRILLAGNVPLPWNRIQNIGATIVSRPYENSAYADSPSYGSPSPAGLQSYGNSSPQPHNELQPYEEPKPYNNPSQPYGNVQIYNNAPHYPTESKSNGFGVAGFVLALIAIFLGWVPIVGWIIWFVGLVLSFVGVFRKPRGLAIAGLIISLIDLILLLVVFAGIASVASFF